MTKSTALRIAALIACGGLLGATAVTAATFKTPEEAVAAYLNGVAAHDFDTILAATAVEEMSTHFDFVAYADRMQMLTPTAPAPTSDPLFVAINRAAFTAAISRELELLVYGLTSTTTFVDGKSAPIDGAGAAAFEAAVDPAQLEDLTVAKIAVPKLALANGDIYRAMATKQAKTYGADEMVERVALLTFKDADYLVGFTVLRYGKGWGISSQTSSLAGTSSVGNPTPITAEEFEEVLK